MKSFVIIAVDGGAASGKSSTSRAISARFNLMHVDTGAHYRTVTLALLDAGISPASPDAAADWLRAHASAALGTALNARSARLAINGTAPKDAALRTPAINAAVSPFAAIPAVRAFLFDYQRAQPRIARENAFAGLIMEGRDIGSVILPDADLRLFLEADPVARAARRAAEGGVDSIAQRDKLDSSRATAPLTVPVGATRIDSTHLSLEQVVDKISALIENIAP
jgi:cytidylate kinase